MKAMMRPPTPRLRRGLRHLCLTLEALQGVYFVDSLDARGPTTTELSLIVTLSFFSWRREELGAFTSASAGVASVVSCDALVGFRDMR